MLTKSSDPHHTISKKSSLRPKTGLRIKAKNPQEFSSKDAPETQTHTIAYIKSTSKPSSPRSVLSPQLQRISSPLLVKSQLYFKRSLSPKEIPVGEKPAASVFKFKVAPKKQEYGSSSPSEEGKRMVDLRNNRIQTQSNNFTQEVEKLEQIRKIKEPQIPMAIFTSPHGSKRGSLNEPQVHEALSLQKIATESEEFPPQHPLAQSSGFDISTVSFVRDRQKSASMVLRGGGGIARRFVSPTAQEYKLSSNFKTPIVEDNHLLFMEGAEAENRPNEKEIKKTSYPMSQAMFRMREFKKAKSIIMKKNKRKLSITTETTNTNSFASKIPSPRPIESPFAKTRPFFSPQGKAKFVFDKPFVENPSQSDINNGGLKEFERNRSETIQNFLNTEKTMTTLPDEGLTIRVTKSLEGQAQPQGCLPAEEENQTVTWHFAPKPKASVNSSSNEFRRKSEIEKYNMKRFLKLTEGSNNSYNTLNSIESPTLPKISEMKDQKSVKKINSFRKPSLEINISIANNSEEKVKRASPKSVTVNPSSPHRKSIFKPPTASANVQQPELQQKQSPKFSPLLKPLESPHLRASKPGERNQNNVIRRKKSGNPLEEIDELSQISIKQFEVNDSFELDNFDFVRKTSIKLKQV